MVIWRDFPYASALFGLQGKLACSNYQGISIYLFQLLDCKRVFGDLQSYIEFKPQIDKKCCNLTKLIAIAPLK